MLLLKNERADCIKAIDHTAVGIIRFAGILFICELTISLLSLTDDGSQVMINRMFGKYWYGFWTFPFAYFFLTQLLWFKKIKDNSFLRIIIALIILFALYIEKFIILMTSLQTPNIEGIAIGFSVQSIILDCLFKLMFFSGFVLLIHFVMERLNKNKTKN
ncbi:MAG TPA: hypothetical protein VK796_08660 [Cytophaga sp.]|nr:hypothetical protein [Cytophaga sp.]